MRHLLGICVLLLVVCDGGRAEGPTLKSARARWLSGNYEEARAAYEELLKDARQRAAAAVGLSRTLQSTGDYDKALAVVDEALTADTKNTNLHARRAELLHLRGKWDDSDKAVETAL